MKTEISLEMAKDLGFDLHRVPVSRNLTVLLEDREIRDAVEMKKSLPKRTFQESIDHLSETLAQMKMERKEKYLRSIGYL